MAAVLITAGCLSQTATVDRNADGPELSSIRCIAVDIMVTASGGEIRGRLIADIQTMFPGIEVTTDPGRADLSIQYQQNDIVVCVHCGEANGSRSQYWSWFLAVGERRFDPSCGAMVTRNFATLWGENHKLGRRPTLAAAVELRKLLVTGRRKTHARGGG